MWLSISIAARICGVYSKTLRRWESQGKIKPLRTKGGHRRYLRNALMDFLKTGEYEIKYNLPTGIAAVYGRVSASKQKNDLQTQISALCEQANNDGFTPKIYRDIGSGLNDRRHRFLRLLIDAIHGKFDRLYLTYRDRLPALEPIVMKRFFIHFILILFVSAKKLKVP